MKITTNHHEYRFVSVGNTIRTVIEAMERLNCTFLYNSKTGEVITKDDLHRTVEILSEFCHMDTME